MGASYPSSFLFPIGYFRHMKTIHQFTKTTLEHLFILFYHYLPLSILTSILMFPNWFKNFYFWSWYVSTRFLSHFKACSQGWGSTPPPSTLNLHFVEGFNFLRFIFFWRFFDHHHSWSFLYIYLSKRWHLINEKCKIKRYFQTFLKSNSSACSYWSNILHILLLIG